MSHVVVGTDQHAFVGDGFDCAGVLGNRDGLVCGQGRAAHIHRSLGELAELSTSARLREVQGALAASQADLTSVELERDGVRAELTRQAATNEDLRATLAMRTSHLAEVKAAAERNVERLAHARQRVGQLERLAATAIMRDTAQLVAELASARQELDILRIQLSDSSERAWQLARQDVGPCGLCDQTIGRGHAVEPMPGAAGYFQHAAGLCPDKEGTDG